MWCIDCGSEIEVRAYCKPCQTRRQDINQAWLDSVLQVDPEAQDKALLQLKDDLLGIIIDPDSGDENRAMAREMAEGLYE